MGHASAPITLDLGDEAIGAGPWAGVPCWDGEQLWAQVHVKVAYAQFYKAARPQLNGGVSVASTVAVACEMARAADWTTGRNSRLSNETISERIGRSVRTVQRARTLLRLLGLATEVLRGRQRTRTERLASWRVGVPARGWASVYALHVRRPVVDNSRRVRPGQYTVSSHPRRGLFLSKSSSNNVVTTHATATKRGASRRSGQRRRATILANNPQGAVLASKWWRNERTPAWVRRVSPTAWAPVCETLAAHGWTPEDLNSLVQVRNEPSNPVGFLRWVLTHTDLDFPPHVELEAERAMARRAADERIEQQLVGRRQEAQRREAGYDAGTAAREQIKRELAALNRRRVDRKGL